VTNKKLRLNVTGGTIQHDILRIVFPAGTGYQRQTVTIQW